MNTGGMSEARLARMRAIMGRSRRPRPNARLVTSGQHRRGEDHFLRRQGCPAVSHLSCDHNQLSIFGSGMNRRRSREMISSQPICAPAHDRRAKHLREPGTQYRQGVTKGASAHHG